MNFGLVLKAICVKCKLISGKVSRLVYFGYFKFWQWIASRKIRFIRFIVNINGIPWHNFKSEKRTISEINW